MDTAALWRALGLPGDGSATRRDVQKAYREMALKNHPDKVLSNGSSFERLFRTALSNGSFERLSRTAPESRTRAEARLSNGSF